MLDQRLAVLKHGPRDVPPRLQDMHTSIAWSFDLLTAEEKAIFRDVAVFVAGFTLTAANAVIRYDDSLVNSAMPTSNGTSVPEADVLYELTALIDKSLLNQMGSPDAEPRFTMLETIREYALEELIASGGEATKEMPTPTTSSSWPRKWSRNCRDLNTGDGSVSWNPTTTTSGRRLPG